MKKNSTLSVHLIFSSVFTNLLFFCFLSTMPSMALGNNNDNGQKAKSKLQKVKVNLKAANTNAIYSKSLSTSVDDATNSELTMPTGIHINDANFAAAIKTACSSCIDVSNNLTTSAASLKTLNVYRYNIANLTGIGGFTSLQSLDCSQNNLTSLPALPTGLISLNCYSNYLTSLPTLPSSLQSLDCSVNSLTSLPIALPSTLQSLDCSVNSLTSLPTPLPSSLQNLDCSVNKLTSLPTSLPSGLQYLFCFNNSLTYLPALPSTLKALYCSYNSLTSLLALPSSLQYLGCYSNSLTSLPTLPSTLIRLRIDYPAICCLPNSVTGLTVLDQAYHDITNTVPLCPTSPSITMQPAPATQSVCINSSPRLITISASEPNNGFTDGSTEKVSFRSGYSYQWYSNANNSNSGGTIITGATSTSYTPLTTTVGTIYYYCIVTNGCSFTTSSTAEVVVNRSPTVSISGLNYVAKYSTITLTGSPTGGTWSSSAAAATIDSATGVVTGVTCGLALITYYVKAEGANSCITKNPQSIAIFVTDTTKPVFSYCPSDISVNNDTSNCSAVVTYTTPTATDNCSVQSVVQSAGLASGSIFPIGTTINIYFASDLSNNVSAPCSFNVTVIDNEKPKITCPSDISVNNDVGNCSAVVTYTTPTATDNCGVPSVAKTAGLATGSIFPLGLTTNTYIATDGSNNTSTCSFNVTVIDNEKPKITCPSDISVNNDVGNCSALVTYKTPTATDNCSVQSVVQTAGLVSGSAFPVGLTTNTFTATDGSNNTSTCSFNVTVIDNEKPKITCPSGISVNNDAGKCSAVVAYTTPTATDNCGAPSVIQTVGLASVTTFLVGLTTNTYTATDGSKNTSTCSFNVTVIDNEKPKITCPSNVTVNSDLGICGAKVNYSVISTDNCSATTKQTVGLASGSTFPIGTTINTYFASDPSNNVSAPCSFKVTVIDNDVPVITSPAATYTACVSDVLNLTASATTNNRTMSVKWQRQNQGGISFTDVTSYAPYISGSIAIYTTPTLFAIDNGAQYRAVFSTNCSSGFNSTATTFQINVCTPPIGQRGFPQGLPDCQKSAFRNLEKIYDTSNGANWKRGADKTKAEAWFTANLSNWYGITMTPDGCDVLAIDLSNNLTQFDQNNYEYIVGLPQNFNYFLDNLAFPKLEKFDMSGNNIRFNIFDYSFPSLKVLNLSNNKLVGNIPELKDCINLQKILVDSNQLSGNIPDFKQLRLDTIDVSTNNFIFGDIANKSWLSKDSTHKLSIAYAPQALIPLRDTNGVLSVFTGEPDNIQKFKWYRIGSNNDTSLEATTRSHRFAPALSGNYYCFITHDILTRPDDVNRNLILKTSNDSIQLSTTVQLSGSIKSENNQAITDVTVSAVETLHATSLKTSTDDRGDFTATLLRSANYQARPIKTSSEDKFSGVSTYDIALISKHILGIEALNSPYKIIAADVDKSNEVDAADILALRRFILNIDTSLQAGIWRFIDKSYEFSNPTNPLSEDFPEVANVNLLTGAPTANFVAIKVGDVNQSYSSEFGKTVVRAAKTVELSVESCELSGDSKVSTTQPTTNNYQLISANEYTIKINAENFTAQTLQGTFQFKDAKVKAVKVGNLANLSDANFGVFTDAVTTSWNGKGSYLNPSVLQIAEITFVANTNAKLTDILSFGSTKTPAVANDANGNEADVVLKFNSSQGVINNYQPSTLSIVPNPAKERVTVNFISTDNATLSIYDLVGRLLKTQIISSGATDINIADLQTGCYLVVVRSNETRLEQKLIKQ